MSSQGGWGHYRKPKWIIWLSAQFRGVYDNLNLFSKGDRTDELSELVVPSFKVLERTEEMSINKSSKEITVWKLQNMSRGL